MRKKTAGKILILLSVFLTLTACSANSAEEAESVEEEKKPYTASEAYMASESGIAVGYVSSISGSEAKNTRYLYVTDSADMVLQCMTGSQEAETVSDTENMRLLRGKCICIRLADRKNAEVRPGDRISAEVTPDASAGKGCFRAESVMVLEKGSSSSYDPVTDGNRRTYTVQGAAVHARELFESSEIFNLKGWLSPVSDSVKYYYVMMSYLLPSREDAFLFDGEDPARAMSGEKTRANERLSIMVPKTTVEKMGLNPGSEVTLTGKLNIYEPEGIGTYIFQAIPDTEDERYISTVDLAEIRNICGCAGRPLTGENAFRVRGYVSSTEMSYNGEELENVYLYITDSPEKVLGVRCTDGEKDSELAHERDRLANGECARARLSKLSALKEWMYSASRIKPGTLVEFTGDLYDNSGSVRFGVESPVRVVEEPENTKEKYSVEDGKKIYTVPGAIEDADALAESGEVVYVRGYVSSVIHGLLNNPSGYLIENRNDALGVYYFGPEEDSTDYNTEHGWTSYSRAVETDAAEQERAWKGESIMIPAQMLVDAKISPKDLVTLAGRFEKRKETNAVRFYCYSHVNENMLTQPCSVGDIINVKTEIIRNYGIVKGYVSSVDMADEKNARIFIVDSTDDIFKPNGAPGAASRETDESRTDRVLCLYTDLTDCGIDIAEARALKPGDHITADGIINYDVVGFADGGSGEYFSTYGYSLDVWTIKNITKE